MILRIVGCVQFILPFTISSDMKPSTRQTNLPYGEMEFPEAPTDGSCMFHSFAHLLNHHRILQNKPCPDELRRQVTQASRELQHIIPEELLDGVSVKKWRKRMKRTRTWGDDIALFLLCVLYKVRVAVHRVVPAVHVDKDHRPVQTVVVEHYPIPLSTLEDMEIAPTDIESKREYFQMTDPICRRRTCVELRLEQSHYTPVTRGPVRQSKRLLSRQSQ